MVNEVIKSVISVKTRVRRGRWLFFHHQDSDSCCTRLQQGREEHSLSVDVVFLLCWKRADRKGCGLISTYLQTEDMHTLRAIRENTAAVRSGRDSAPRSTCHEIQTLKYTLSQSSPSLADMGPINHCKQPRCLILSACLCTLLYSSGYSSYFHTSAWNWKSALKHIQGCNFHPVSNPSWCSKTGVSELCPCGLQNPAGFSVFPGRKRILTRQVGTRPRFPHPNTKTPHLCSQPADIPHHFTEN